MCFCQLFDCDTAKQRFYRTKSTSAFAEPLDLDLDAHRLIVLQLAQRLRWLRTRILCHIEGPCWICVRPMLRDDFGVQMPEKDCYVEHLRRKHTKTMMKLKPRVEDMWSRTLTINGFSKAFSMTGLSAALKRYGQSFIWAIAAFCSYCLPQNCTLISTPIASCCTLTGYRLGYLAAQKDIVKAVSKLQSQCLGSFGVLVLESLPWSPVLYSKHISNTLRGRAL